MQKKKKKVNNLRVVCYSNLLYLPKTKYQDIYFFDVLAEYFITHSKFREQFALKYLAKSLVGFIRSGFDKACFLCGSMILK